MTLFKSEKFLKLHLRTKLRAYILSSEVRKRCNSGSTLNKYMCVAHPSSCVVFFFVVVIVNISSFSLKRILSLIPVLLLMNLSQWLKFPFFLLFVALLFALCCFLVLHLSLAVMVWGADRLVWREAMDTRVH